MQQFFQRSNAAFAAGDGRSARELSVKVRGGMLVVQCVLLPVLSSTGALLHVSKSSNSASVLFPLPAVVGRLRGGRSFRLLSVRAAGCCSRLCPLFRTSAVSAILTLEYALTLTTLWCMRTCLFVCRAATSSKSTRLRMQR